MAQKDLPRKSPYRALALRHYQPVCVYCGFGIQDILEVAHLDGSRTNNEIGNLAILCPTCHKMHDIDLIPTEVIVQMRDRPKQVRWAKRMKDAGRKAVITRRKKAAMIRKKWRQAGLRAAATRRKRKEAFKGVIVRT